jgi:hypothetical protein
MEIPENAGIPLISVGGPSVHKCRRRSCDEISGDAGNEPSWRTRS